MLLDAPALSIYDRDGRFLDWLRAPAAFRGWARSIGAGTVELTVSPRDPRAELLRAPGARVQTEVRGDPFVGGPVTAWTTSGPGHEHWVFTVTDDAALLDRLIAFPDPAAALTAQPPGPRSVAGKLESVVKQLVAENAPIVGIPVDIAADQGRGPVVTVTGRFQPLSDMLHPHLRAAGMGVTVRWQPTTRRLLLDVTEPRTYPVQLSVQTRTITRYEISSSAPRSTRVYLGASEGSAFTVATNATAETEWGTHLRGATFRSATGDEINTAATEALEDAGPKSGMSIALAETGYVRYGGEHGIRVGDRVTLRVGDVEITDLVNEVAVEWSADKPLTITPGVGAWDQSPVTVLAEAVRRVGATMRRYTNR